MNKQDKPKAIAYCRTASASQLEAVEKLHRQKEQIKEAAKRLNIEVIRWFEQVGQAEKAKFPYASLGEVMGYCKSHPEIKTLLVTQPDRIARSYEEMIFWKVSFKRIGVTIMAADKKEAISPMEQFMEHLKYMVGQLDHQHRSEAIKRGFQRKKEREHGEAGA